MIIICPKCKTKWNNETVDVCPWCAQGLKRKWSPKPIEVKEPEIKTDET